MVTEVRGQGVMWGLELDRPACDVVDAARPLGLLVNATAKTVVRLLPPLTMTEAEVNEAVTRLDAAMTAVAGAIPMTATALAQLRPHLAVTPGSSSIMRTARREDAAAIHALVMRYREAGRLLPRDRGRDRAARRALPGHPRRRATSMGCAELAPLSAKVAEVRSLVVDEQPARPGSRPSARRAVDARGARGRLQARSARSRTNPGIFVRLGFSLVPHAWLPEKIAADCAGCPLFRQCGQSAMRLHLAERQAPRASRACA